MDAWTDDATGILYAMEYYSAMKRNAIMPTAATWMQLEIIILSGVRHNEKEKY